jgi:hypothetical protein
MILDNLSKYIVKKQSNITKLNNQKIGIYWFGTPKTSLRSCDFTNIAVRISNYVYEKSSRSGYLTDRTIYLYVPDKMTSDCIKTKCIIIELRD